MAVILRATMSRRLFFFGLCVSLASPAVASAATYYVRSTVGDDSHDGLSPATAWKHPSMLGPAMHAGDTAYVGPGLYRDEIVVEHDGAPDARLTFVADTTGQHTGDPPGVVMLAGSEPVDGETFSAGSAPGVYTTAFPAWVVWGVVEMDGPQGRYLRVTITHEYLVEKMREVDIVAKIPSSYFYDEASRQLTIHTSDGRPPASHEMELIRRGDGIFIRGHHHVNVVGFTFRHMQDAGVSFFVGSGDGVVADVTSYGSRQGVRVYGAPGVTVYGSTLFRNENAGVYFAAKSVNGLAIANASYENVKGLRWSSDSGGGMALDNALFDNSERGLSLENVSGAILRRNRFVDNAVSQLQVLESVYTSEDNCFETRGAELVADFTPFGPLDRYPDLASYRAARAADSHSRDGGCGTLPAKVDVHALHRRALAYPAAPSEPWRDAVRDWVRGVVGGTR
jgi:parallel beta helix pectate lyase-like protein